MLQRITGLLSFWLAGSTLAGLYAVGQWPSFVLSSLALCLMLLLVIYRFGVISVPAFVAAACFVPPLAFFWAWLHDVPYINAQNLWLQDDDDVVDRAVMLSLISSMFALGVMWFYRQQLESLRVIRSYGQFVPWYTYPLLCAAGMFFFWLAEPSFSTILVASSNEVKAGRFEGTQYAGSVALIIWVMAALQFLTSRARRERNEIVTGERTVKIWFVCLTGFAIVWLTLHSRRNELLGIGLVSLILLSEKIGKQLTVCVAAVLVFLLIGLGEIRFLSLSGYLANEEVSSQGELFKRIPGGASNVYMTFVAALDYFDTHPFLSGETLSNYLRNLLPSNLASAFKLARPEYFFQRVYSGYDYNGGTYAGAVFYGNFGVPGVIAFGMFAGAYTTFIAAALASNSRGLALVGGFMLAALFRVFWYEMIVLIKPAVILFLPVYLLVRLARNARRTVYVR